MWNCHQPLPLLFGWWYLGCLDQEERQIYPDLTFIHYIRDNHVAEKCTSCNTFKGSVQSSWHICCLSSWQAGRCHFTSTQKQKFSVVSEKRSTKDVCCLAQIQSGCSIATGRLIKESGGETWKEMCKKRRSRQNRLKRNRNRGGPRQNQQMNW